MAFSDLEKAAMDFAVLGPASEVIEVKHLDGAPEASVPWESLRAQVDREPDQLGFSTDAGRQAVEVHVSKTDVPAVDELRDLVRLKGSQVYRVVKVTEFDGSWELYCQ